jgi:ABC-2 type transport system ATP-binding protein
MAAASAYTVRGLTKTYRRASTPAVIDLDLDIPAGEVFGLLGPNGAGKTTLVRHLVGLAKPDGGSVSLFGHDVTAAGGAPARWVGYLAQDEPALTDLPVRQAAATTARLRGVSRRDAARAASAVIEELGLEAVADRPMVSLSGGQRRLGCLASALTADRPVLVLDEPTTGLDPVARRAVWSVLQRRRSERGTTIVLVTHNVIEAESVLDRVAVMDHGSVIACDTPARLTAAVDDHVRLGLVWRHDPPVHDPVVEDLRRTALVTGRRWSVRLPRADARSLLGRLMSGPVLDAVDDVTVTSPSLEDVYLALGGRGDDMERS